MRASVSLPASLIVPRADDTGAAEGVGFAGLTGRDLGVGDPTRLCAIAIIFVSTVTHRSTTTTSMKTLVENGANGIQAGSVSRFAFFSDTHQTSVMDCIKLFEFFRHRLR